MFVRLISSVFVLGLLATGCKSSHPNDASESSSSSHATATAAPTQNGAQAKSAAQPAQPSSNAQAKASATAAAQAKQSAANATKHVSPRAWEHASSDIPADPRIHFGALDNGMRYAWLENAEPKERSYLRLHVDVGSLSETDDERGMAHFLEHMAFNGSKHYKSGELVEWFQHHGMAFGADTNASTGFSETVYELDLPNSDAKLLNEGLSVLRDFADGLLLEQTDVDAEKGVVDAEERERDSAGYRLLKHSLAIELEGTRVPDRLPIGEKSVRDRFDSKSVRNFYTKWYRPENMTLVLVGDLRGLDPTTLITDAFDGMLAPASALEHEPALGTPTTKVHSYVITEKELATEAIGVDRATPWVDKPDTSATWKSDLPLDVARTMLNVRFSELVKKENAPFLNSAVSDTRESNTASGIRVRGGENLTVVCAPEKWESALATCVEELHRVLEFGFQKSELDEVRANMLRGLNEAVEREKTRSSSSYVGDLLDACELRSVPTNAATRKRILTPAIEALTVEAAHDAFKKAWNEGTLLVSAGGPLDLGAGGDQKLSDAFAAALAKKVEARATNEDKPWAYASDANTPGTIKSRSHVDDLDFEVVEFANGVTVRVKKTDFKERQIMIASEFGAGQLTLDASVPAQRALGWAGARLFNAGGLVAHSNDELRRLNAGKNVSVGFSVGDDHFSLGGVTTGDDLARECEMMCAFLTAPGWREEGLRQLQKSIPVTFERFKHEPGGPIALEFWQQLYSGDHRLTFPDRAALEAVTMADVRQWLEPQLANETIDIALVGDLDVDKTIEIAQRTFGALPQRNGHDTRADRRKDAKLATGLKLEYPIDSEVPKTLVLIVFPATDGRDAVQRRSLQFLADVIGDRLRVQVRERLGASYSPSASAQLSQVYPNDGWIGIDANSDPEKVNELVDACLDVAQSLAQDGVTQEEVDRLRGPTLNELRDTQRQNPFWAGILSSVHSDPNTLDNARTLIPFFKDATAEQLTPFAKSYLGRDRAVVVTVVPKGKQASNASAPVDPDKK